MLILFGFEGETRQVVWLGGGGGGGGGGSIVLLSLYAYIEQVNFSR